MIDALISPVVGGALSAVSIGVGAYSVGKIQNDELADAKLPLMGVSGALVFAGQMINFTIPATGSSGHIGGGILLAGLLGGFPAFLTIAAVLIIQCLFFADGGLLALGCNIFNMGVIPCLMVYPLLFKPLLKKGMSAAKLSLAAIASAVISLELGAFGVVLETLASGITTLPFGTFAALMLPIHLAIGVTEGIVTAAVLVFVWQMRPEILEAASARTHIEKGAKTRNVLVTLAILALMTGTAFSLFASSHPDGLEWAMEKTAGTAELEPKSESGIYDGVLGVQEDTAFLPDYAFASDPDNIAGTSVSGIVGSVLVFAVAGAAGLAITAVKKRKKISV
jgi:cobalt/nickel transport system permease protein